jgi:hypothetical protein
MGIEVKNVFQFLKFFLQTAPVLIHVDLAKPLF